MPPFMYQCPTTGLKVQGVLPDGTDESDDADDSYRTVTCVACGMMHLVNPRSGRVVGGDPTSD